MSLKKVSLLLLFCSASCFQISAMEKGEPSNALVIAQIKSNLDRLNLSILDFTQQVKSAKEQKEKDKTIYINYITQEKERASKAWIFKAPLYDVAEVRNYKGDTCYGPYSYYNIPGSKQKYRSLKKELSERELLYLQFITNLQRGQSYIDKEPQKATDYLNNVNSRLQKFLDADSKRQEWLDTIAKDLEVLADAIAQEKTVEQKI